MYPIHMVAQLAGIFEAQTTVVVRALPPVEVLSTSSEVRTHISGPSELRHAALYVAEMT